jgi:hypothetical protein
VPDDDDILEAYERELDSVADPRPRSNRGFWLVVGSFALTGMILVGEIVANRPIKDTIGHAEYSLRAAQAAAQQIRATEGSYAAADPDAMASAAPTLTYRAAGDPSTGLDDLSLATGGDQWAAAVQVRPGACFYLRMTETGDTYYGAGTDCTGLAALQADRSSW